MSTTKKASGPAPLVNKAYITTPVIAAQTGIAPTDTKDTAMQNVSATGTAPRKRFATSAAAYKLYSDLKDKYYPVALLRARVQGMYDGNPPYDSAELQRLGQSFRCNVNFREMESIVDTNTSAAWSLHMDVSNLIEVDFDTRKVTPGPDSHQWASIISEEYTRCLFKWPGFYSGLNQSLHDYFIAGIGGATWPNEWDWRSEPFKHGNLLVPPLTSTDINKIECCFLRSKMQLGDLYTEIENRDAAQKRGWNIEAVKNLIVKEFYGDSKPTATDGDNTQTSPWESYQERVKLGDPDVQSREYEGVEIVHVLVREVSAPRKISHYIISEREDLSDKWLFAAEQKYDKLSKILWLLPYSYGDGYLRSSRGLGQRSLTHCEFSNRLLCTTFDGGMLSASLLVKPRTGIDAARMSLLRIGPVTVMPEGLEAVQTSFTPNISNLVSLRTISKDILHNNTGVFRPRNENAANDTAPKTAQQVRSEENREARFERNQVEHFYTHWQMWHEEVFSRLTRKDYIKSSLDLPGLEEAKEFVERCVARGVPEKILLDPKAIEIKVARAIGMGSPSVKLDLTNQLVAMKGSMDEVGRREADREWASVRVGHLNVDRFFPRGGSRDSIPSNAHSFAVLENNDFIEGKQVPVGSDQPHIIHCSVHFARVQQIMQAYEQGQLQDPIAAVTELQQLLPHTAQHIQALAPDATRKAQVQQMLQLQTGFAKFYAELLRVAEQFIQQRADEAAEAEDQAAQQAQPLTPEAQVEMAKVQGQLQLEAAKQRSLNDMRAQKTMEQMNIRKAQVASDMNLKNMQVEAELERKRRLTDADVTAKTA